MQINADALQAVLGEAIPGTFTANGTTPLTVNEMLDRVYQMVSKAEGCACGPAPETSGVEALRHKARDWATLANVLKARAFGKAPRVSHLPSYYQNASEMPDASPCEVGDMIRHLASTVGVGNRYAVRSTLNPCTYIKLKRKLQSAVRFTLTAAISAVDPSSIYVIIQNPGISGIYGIEKLSATFTPAGGAPVDIDPEGVGVEASASAVLIDPGTQQNQVIWQDGAQGELGDLETTDGKCGPCRPLLVCSPQETGDERDDANGTQPYGLIRIIIKGTVDPLPDNGVYTVRGRLRLVDDDCCAPQLGENCGYAILSPAERLAAQPLPPNEFAENVA